MFRNLRRKKQELDRIACERLLLIERRGALGMEGSSGYPYVIPINYLYCSENGSSAVYFHSAKEGHKVDALASNPKVCFTVWNKGTQEEGDWSYFVDSVICFGEAMIVEDEQERLEYTKKFAMKYFDNEEEVDADLEQNLPRMLLYRIDVQHMCGKHVHER